MKRIVSGLFFLFSLIGSLFADEYYFFNHLDSEEGLSQSTILSIAQDSLGFIWLGTMDGLNRFDGYEVEKLQMLKNDSLVLQNSRINALACDQNGKLWIGTDRGVHSYNPINDDFHFYKWGGKIGPVIRTLLPVNKQMILVGTLHGLYRLIPNTGQVILIRYFTNGVNRIKKISENRILFSSGRILYVFQDTSIHEVYTLSSKNAWITDFVQDGDSVLWVLSNEDLLQLNLSTGKVSHFTRRILCNPHLKTAEFSGLLFVRPGELWITTNRGLIGFNVQDKKAWCIKGNLETEHFTLLFKDRQNIIWIGSLDDGVRYFDLRSGRFNNILPKLDKQHYLSDPLVYAIYVDNRNTLWVGTNGGLDRIDLKRKKYRHYLRSINGNKNRLNTKIRALFEDSNGILWIGTYDGLYRFNPRTEKFKRYRAYDSPVKNIVLKIFPLNNGIFLIGFKESGLFVFDPKTEKFTLVEFDSQGTVDSKALFVTDIVCTSDGRILVGTYGNSLLELKMPDRKLEYVFPPKSPLRDLCSFIYSIHEDAKGTIWLGTYGRGLYSYNFKNQTYKNWSTKNGLPNNVVYGILEDQNHNLWISTNKGLCKIKRDKLHSKKFNAIRVFDSADGLPSNEFNFGAYFKDAKGLLYFGTIHGLTFFDPKRFKENSIPPRVLISEVKINNMELRQVLPDLNIDLFIKPATIVLEHDQNRLYFEFIALHFLSPFRNKIAYKLEGLDEDWIYTSMRERFALYRRLRPGKYKFWLKAANADGHWSKPLILTIIIRRPFWQTWWFYILLGLILLFILYSAHQFRIRSIRKRNLVLNDLYHKLKAENQAKLKIMNDLKESIEKFRTIFENVPLGIFYINKDSVITDCNQNFTKIIGSPYEKLVGLNLLRDLKDEKLQKAVADALNTGTGFYEGEYHAITSDRVISVRVTINGIYAGKDEIVGAVGIVEDLTREEEEQLRESIIRNIASAVHATEDLESFYQIFQYELSKIINTRNLFIALYDDRTEMLTFPLMKDEKMQFKTAPARKTLSHYVIKKGRALLFTEAQILDLVKDGEIEVFGTMAKCWLGVPLRVGNKIIGILVVQDYESEEAFNEDDLKLLEVLAAQLASFIKQKQDQEIINLLTRGIEQSSLTLLVADRNGDVIYSNLNKYNSFLFQFERANLRNILKYNLIGDSSFIDQCLEKGEKWNGEILRKIDDNLEHWEFLSINPIYDARHELTHFVIVLEDITEAKHLQNQLLQSQKIESIGTLAGGIAHDFNNLLTVINGHAEMALLKLNQNKKIHSDIISILHAGKKAANLTRQLLAFSRKQIFKAEILNLNEVIQNMEKMVRRLIGEDILIKIQLAPQIPYIKADPGQLEQVLLNLIVNARDAIHEWSKQNQRHDKVITIKTEKVIIAENDRHYRDISPGTYVSLIVADTGVGMTKEVKQKLFEPFFTTKEVGKGTGLGLSTVYGIVKQNQGFIDVKTEVGQGAQFIVYWPAALGQKQSANQKDENSELVEGKGTILVVEDDPSVRDFVQDILEQSGYQVFVATNGHEAFEIVKRFPQKLDLVITDIVMPKMNGNELADLIFTHSPTTKILFTSGYTETRIINEGLMKEGRHFLHKPFTVAELTQAVRKILES